MCIAWKRPKILANSLILGNDVASFGQGAQRAVDLSVFQDVFFVQINDVTIFGVVGVYQVQVVANCKRISHRVG